MSEIVNTIGVAGEYDTIAAWVAALPTIGTAGDTVIGEVIDYEADCNIAFPTTVAASGVIFRPAAALRHRGFIGSGCRLLPAASSACITASRINYSVLIDGFEIDYQAIYTPVNTAGVVLSAAGESPTMVLQNSILYGFAVAGGSNVAGVKSVGFGGARLIRNCAVFRARRASGFGGCINYDLANSATAVHHCLSVDAMNLGLANGVGFNSGSATLINCVDVGSPVGFSGTVNAASTNNAATNGMPHGPNSQVAGYRDYQALLGGNASLVAGSNLVAAGSTVLGLGNDLAGNLFGSPPAIGPAEFALTASNNAQPPITLLQPSAIPG